jgi:Carboxypeptidase regulatory-like domain
VRFFQFLFLFFNLSAGLQSSLPQATPTGTLKGIVRGPAGELASEVKVRIENWYFDQGMPHFLTEIVVYTNQNGEFSVAVPAGNYDVIISRLDCEPVAKKLKVVSGKETVFSPQLKGSKLAEFIE